MPSLLIKDHKPCDKMGDFPTRLIVPAAHFVASFGKVGYLGLAKIFSKHGIVVDRFTITQAADVKLALEKLGLHQGDVTIVSLDVENIYPSVTYHLIARAVRWFARDLPGEAFDAVLTCLSMIQFGMSHTPLTFGGKYFEYTGGETEVSNRGLAIGGFESAWLADVVASYLLENTCSHFDGNTVYRGIYRDNGLVVFSGFWRKGDVASWLSTFQQQVDDLAGSSFLKFTAVVWGTGRVHDDLSQSPQVTVNCNDFFPYLDLKMCWVEESLHFSVHLKPNQHLKYLNAESTHSPSCLEAIPHGVLGRLARLTTLTEENENVGLDRL
jgi:hypothetical protein